MTGLTDQERADLLEYLTEWRQTCSAMGVPFTPSSIAEWLTDSTGFLPRLKADAVAAARAEVLAKVREFPPLMADAWGGDQSWLTTGTKVADLVADWLGADLDDALVADLGGDHG